MKTTSWVRSSSTAARGRAVLYVCRRAVALWRADEKRRGLIDAFCDCLQQCFCSRTVDQDGAVIERISDVDIIGGVEHQRHRVTDLHLPHRLRAARRVDGYPTGFSGASFIRRIVNDVEPPLRI